MARISRPFIIFAAIGVVNTAIDAGIFVLLHSFGLGIIVANLISTSVAIIVSYLLNSKFTFTHSGGLTKEKAVKFIGITLTGQWILQPVIIYIAMHAMRGVGFESYVMSMTANWQEIVALLAKMCAIPATLVWNYVLYRRVVFTK